MVGGDLSWTVLGVPFHPWSFWDILGEGEIGTLLLKGSYSPPAPKNPEGNYWSSFTPEKC